MSVNIPVACDHFPKWNACNNHNV